MPTRIIIFNAVQLCACFYALRRGGAPERWTAWMMAGAAALTALRPFMTDAGYRSVNPIVLTVDTMLLLGMAVLACRADRFWPIWAAALQLVAIAVHATRALDPMILPEVYNRTLGKVAYPMIAMLVIGTLRHIRRKEAGNERDWSPLRW